MRYTSIAALAAALAGTLVSAVPVGFVTTKGEKFSLDGKEFFFAGSNAYYFPFNIVCQVSAILVYTLTFAVGKGSLPGRQGRHGRCQGRGSQGHPHLGVP